MSISMRCVTGAISVVLVPVEFELLVLDAMELAWSAVAFTSSCDLARSI